MKAYAPGLPAGHIDSRRIEEAVRRAHWFSLSVVLLSQKLKRPSHSFVKLLVRVALIATS